MDLEDSRKLAENCTRLFCDTAFAIMKEQKGTESVKTSTRLAGLGSRLQIIHDTLTNTTPEQEGFISERVPGLLDWLESLCTVGNSLERGQAASITHAAKGKSQSNLRKDRQLKYPNLRNVSSAQTNRHHLVTGLEAFAAQNPKTIEKCFSRLDRFGVKGSIRGKREGHQPIEDLKAKLEEQASWVIDPSDGNHSRMNQAFYEALCCPCTCLSKTRQGFVCSQHWTRLQLYDGVEIPQDKVIFDAVFSSNPAPSPGADVKWRWQQLRFEIPKLVKHAVGAEQKNELHSITPFRLEAPHRPLSSTHREGDNLLVTSSGKKKGVGFAGYLSYPINGQQDAFEEQYDPLPAENFCQLLNDWVGDIKKRLRIEGGDLYRMYDPAPPGPSIRSNPSMSLAKLLEGQEVSSKDKISLAYILARATWQYYSSDFMKVRWTSGTIHFIPEEPLPLDIDNHDDQKRLDPSKPYFAFQFDGSDDPASVEFYDSRDLLHKYPRILALAILLTEIGCPNGKLQREPAHELQIQINNDWNSAHQYLISEKWPNFGFRNPRTADTYRLVVSKCLDQTAFHIPSSADSHANDALVEQRRAILYKSVVHPLYQLLADGGLLEEDTEPRCQGESRSSRDEDILQVPAHRDPRCMQFESGSRRHKAPSYTSCSALLSPAVDTFFGSSARHRPLYTEYTVGWICAVEVEMVAACELLDEEYDRPAFYPKNDNNIYTLGRIGNHKVVIVPLPKGKYGTVSAAAVARDMLRSFPSITFRLMVGIAGGAPSQKHDVRLGDIVVSSPDQCSGGVVHYDFGKAIQSKEFQRTGSLNAPPPLLLSASQSLSVQHRRYGHQISRAVTQLVRRNPRLKCDFQRPDPETDRLYQAAYLHKDNTKSCEEACDQGKTMLQIRPHRDETGKTVIHHGLIASADKLMKDAQVRDALAEKEGILCFEMEAAGLMDHFPCLVIRGICDYSDTHKNDAWQGYAAVAAAAYAKELLEMIPPTEIQAS